MPACETCWKRASQDVMLLGGSVVDHYRRRIKAADKPCEESDPAAFTDGSGRYYSHTPSPSDAETWHDPTHGRIDRDIQEQVDATNPESLGQRVALENTLQTRRDRERDGSE